jgi:hypothetical protein
LTQKEIVILCCAIALLAFSPFYGRRIGVLGKRRSWSIKKIKRRAALPLLIPSAILFILSLVFKLSGPDYLSGALWAVFPFSVSVGTCTFAMLIAARVARPGGVLLEVDEKD